MIHKIDMQAPMQWLLTLGFVINITSISIDVKTNQTNKSVKKYILLVDIFISPFSSNLGCSLKGHNLIYYDYRLHEWGPQ